MDVPSTPPPQAGSKCSLENPVMASCPPSIEPCSRPSEPYPGPTYDEGICCTTGLQAILTWTFPVPGQNSCLTSTTPSLAEYSMSAANTKLSSVHISKLLATGRPQQSVSINSTNAASFISETSLHGTSVAGIEDRVIALGESCRSGRLTVKTHRHGDMGG